MEIYISVMVLIVLLVCYAVWHVKWEIDQSNEFADEATRTEDKESNT